MTEISDNTNIDNQLQKNEAGKEKAANCRFYEQKFPEVDDLVMVEVRSVEDMGANVVLKEYNDAEGLIMSSELSRRRIRSINKIIRVGRLEVVVVMRVDKEKGYIDLSKRRVSDEEVIKCTEKYNKSKKVHSILKHAADKVGMELEQVYIKFGWPLYQKYGHAYDGLRLALIDPDAIFQGLDIEPELREALLSNISHHMAPQPVKVRADLEVTCFQYEGIDAIKAALRRGESTSTEHTPIKIKLVAPPLFVIITSSLHKESAIKAVEDAIHAMKDEIQKYNGDVVVKIPPRTVQERDEKELTTLMKKLSKMNSEVPGDDDYSEEED